MEVNYQQNSSIAEKYLEETISKAKKLWTREGVENNARYCKQ